MMKQLPAQFVFQIAGIAHDKRPPDKAGDEIGQSDQHQLQQALINKRQVNGIRRNVQIVDQLAKNTRAQDLQIRRQAKKQQAG